METKVCSKCGEILTLEHFGIKKANTGGLNCRCKNCIKEDNKRYREEHADEIKDHRKVYMSLHKDKVKITTKRYSHTRKAEIDAYGVKYRKANVEKELIRGKKYRNENRIKVNIGSLKYARTHRDQVNILNSRRRTKEKGLPATLTNEQWDLIKIYFNNECCYCGRKFPLEREHFISLDKKGGFTKNNIVCACRSCNGHKSAKDFFVWYPTYEFYSKKREKIILKYLGYENMKKDVK